MRSLAVSRSTFVEKDPVVDVIRTLIHNQPRAQKEVAIAARLHPQTLDALLYGKTRRPQHRTVRAICDVLGVDVRYVLRATDREVTVVKDIWRQFIARRKKHDLRVVK